jgi:AraC family transcriptional regulator
MTIYEQVQAALDHMEGRLFAPLSRAGVARAAGMSDRSFAHYFWALTGYSYKEYLVKRRLAEAALLLTAPGPKVIDVALEVGYRSHEAFSRAFKSEFGVSPLRFRRDRPGLRGLAKLSIVKESFMGVIVKELPRMLMAAFEGYAPNPEDKAWAKLKAWQEAHPAAGRPRRVFGHNIDAQGRLDCNPKNVGYKLLIGIESPGEAGGAKTEVLEAGKFAVTGIEGNFKDDPSGTWIAKGWERMSALIAERGFRLKETQRWFEESLEPEIPGNLRLDLYVEIE